MALHFLTSTDQTFIVVVTSDPSVSCNDEQRAEYLNTGDLSKLDNVGEDATKFTLKPLGPAEREQAEIRAGAFSRSELGRYLWVEAPNDPLKKARWHHKLAVDEREALASYESYISRVYVEMIRESLLKINDEDASVDMIQTIRPDALRIGTITELVLHIQRASLVGDAGK
tara:strand:- start:226 stop:738 length:513 start_codon:yes stop_codon:yes gene_type:complete